MSNIRNQIDADLKLKREAEFIRNIPNKQSIIFPEYFLTEDDSERFGYILRFVQGYTFSERIFQGRMNITEAKSLLSEILSKLTDGLYGHTYCQSPLCCMEKDYRDRIRRRVDQIFDNQDTSGNSLRKVFEAPYIYVNGKLCLGYKKIMNWLSSKEELIRWLFDSQEEMAHGDLILDNIVIDGSKNIPILIDPNGDCHTRIYDIGKMFLSLYSCYEFFKYNKFWINLNSMGKDNVPCLEIGLESNCAIKIYEAMLDYFVEILQDNSLLKSKHLKLSGIDILLLNGLQNLSLPMFHLLHHKNENRALAFLAIGILQLSRVVELTELGKSPGLKDVSNGSQYSLFD